MLTNLIQSLVDGLGSLAKAGADMLPPSPFESLEQFILGNEILGWINFFVPVSAIVATLGAWTAAIIVYYAVKVINRFAKLIG